MAKHGEPEDPSDDRRLGEDATIFPVFDVDVPIPKGTAPPARSKAPRSAEDGAEPPEKPMGEAEEPTRDRV